MFLYNNYQDSVFVCIKKANGSYIKLSAILNEKCNSKYKYPEVNGPQW